MSKNQNKSLPHFSSLDELVKFFDSNDLGEFLDDLPEIEFDVDLQEHSHIFTLDEDLTDMLTKISITRKIPSEVLINSWLRERITNTA